jgi:hypothetical protein
MVARIEAYSAPITPPPMIVIDLGSVFRVSKPSVSMML